jgi:hypothetical protein
VLNGLETPGGKGTFYKVQDCPDYEKDIESKERQLYVPFLAALEDYFNCSGICSKSVSTYYLFTSNLEYELQF